MYNLYHTDGIVLSASDFGEADRIYNIYTKDFGLAALAAKGIRTEKSKLRAHLGLYSLVRLSFIEGKDYLRLTDAEEIAPPPLRENSFAILAGMGVFIERMVRGQEKDENVWKLLNGVWSNVGCLAAENFEPIFKARLLQRLGYVSSEADLVTGDDWFGESAKSANLEQINKILKEGLSASQL